MYRINLTIWLVERVITSGASGLLATPHTTFNLIFGIFLGSYFSLLYLVYDARVQDTSALPGKLLNVGTEIG